MLQQYSYGTKISCEVSQPQEAPKKTSWISSLITLPKLFTSVALPSTQSLQTSLKMPRQTLHRCHLSLNLKHLHLINIFYDIQVLSVRETKPQNCQNDKSIHMSNSSPMVKLNLESRGEEQKIVNTILLNIASLCQCVLVFLDMKVLYQIIISCPSLNK